MKMINKPFAESCEQNKLPILAVLHQVFGAPGKVLEIGSGTGQHAAFFSSQLPHLIWQASDRAEHLAGITLWLNEAARSNLPTAIQLDVASDWPEDSFDYIFSANTVHIMSWSLVGKMFEGIRTVLKPGGMFCLYGPFNYDGRFTSDSNARFDDWLKQRDPASGIRDLADLTRLAQGCQLTLQDDVEMPVNNRILVWQKLPD